MKMELSILNLKDCWSKFLLNNVPIPEARFYLANSTDPDEMSPYVPFHLGLHCLQVSGMIRVRLHNIFFF